VTTLSWDISVSAESTLNICEPGSTKAKRGSLSITLETNIESVANATAHSEPSYTSYSANVLSPITTSTRVELSHQDPTALTVTVQNADKSVAALRSPLYTSHSADIVDHASAASSSDSFNSALSIMGNLIKFGDVLSEVSLSLQFMSTCILNTSMPVSPFRKVGLEHPDCSAEGTSYVSLRERC
jgi:hypothetical protein